MQKKIITVLSILFFMFGFITCLNDILVPFLKAVFVLDYAQAALVQLCFFGAYGLTSIPASTLIEKVGYQKGIIIGFVVTALGCVLFFPAVSFHSYNIFLGALFILAMGVVVLQVAANPLVALMGPPETASSRLTMTQAFNSLGTFLAPMFGSWLILSKLEVSGSAESVKYPYLFIALVLVLIAGIFATVKFPEIKKHAHSGSWMETLKNKTLVLGMIGIFAYVGAEVAIGTFLVNFIMETLPMGEAEAANMVALYWGGAMAGRFIGIFTLKMFRPGKVLAFHGLLSILLVIISIKTTGQVSVYSMILVGLCNSIMFPTIFTLGIKDSVSSERASGLLATSIIGGAFIPYLTGQMADGSGLRMAMILPIICYAYIVFFGWKFRGLNIKITE